MAKRFTDTEKWKKSLLKSIPTEYKLLWLYICDDCNHAGIWDVDMNVASLRIGAELSLCKAEEIFGDKIIIFDSGEKWFMPSFIEFQYGELRDNNKAHISVIKILEKYDLLKYVESGFNTPLNNNIKGNKKLQVFERDNYTCSYCGEKYEESYLQPDHIIPLNKGGTNDIENVTTACNGCNRKKSDSDLDYFIINNGLDKEKIYYRIYTSRGIIAPSIGAKDKDKDKEQEMDMDKEKEYTPNPNFLIPSMQRIFKEKNTSYIPDKERDYPPLLKIAQFISKQENVEFQARSPDEEKRILEIWSEMSAFISTNNFFSTKALSTISNQIQAICLEYGKPATGKKSNKSLDEAFAEYYSQGG